MPGPLVICTVTNDLHQDQRMRRICSAFVDFGCEVRLVGRLKPTSTDLRPQPYEQHRIRVSQQVGPRFYYEYNKRLEQYLLHEKPDLIYAVDTDTLMAAGRAKKKLGCKLIVDMHEYFTEVPELIGRTLKKAVWRQVERRYMPLADGCITVGPALAHLFEKLYHKPFAVVRNVPERAARQSTISAHRIVYQGVLNKGRGLTEAIDAMAHIDDPALELHIVGGGDLDDQLRAYTSAKTYARRVVFHGWKYGTELTELTQSAWLGLNLLQADSLSYHYSLANKFFDYMHAGVPSLNMNLPEYVAIVAKYEVAILLKELDARAIAGAINQLRADPEHYSKLVAATEEAAEVYQWATEKETLQQVYCEVMAIEI